MIAFGSRLRAPLPCAAVALAIIAGSSAPALARDEPTPIVVFYAPPSDDPSIALARRAMGDAARQRGTTVIDRSPAPEPPAQAPRLLARGIEAYHNFRNDDALAALDQALAEARATGAAGMSNGDLSDLLLYRALVTNQLGDAAAAWDFFVAAAVIDPGRRLDPVRFPPRVVETYGRAVEAVIAGQRARVTIEAPAPCRVWLDGRATEPGFAVELPWGEHFVRAECPAARPWSTTVAVAGDRAAITPTPVVTQPPDRAEVTRLARDRGALMALAAHVAISGGQKTLTLRLLDLASGKVRARAIEPLGPQTTVAGLVDAVDALIASTVATAPPPVVIQRETPWYRREWVWGVAGAALAAAVLTPLLLDGDTPTGFDVRPGGDRP